MSELLEKRVLEAPPEVWQQLETVCRLIHNVNPSNAFIYCVAMGFAMTQTLCLNLGQRRPQNPQERLEKKTLEAPPRIWQQFADIVGSKNIVSESDAFVFCVSVGLAVTKAIELDNERYREPPLRYDDVYRDTNISPEEIKALQEKSRATGRIQRVIAPGAALAWLIIFPSGGMRQAYST